MPDDAELWPAFAEGWSEPRQRATNPRGRIAGRLARCAGQEATVDARSSPQVADDSSPRAARPSARGAAPRRRSRRARLRRAGHPEPFSPVAPGKRSDRQEGRSIGVYSDGFIHAGNLAYLALLSLFPFVIVAAAMRAAGRPRRGGDERGQRHPRRPCRPTSPTCCARRSPTCCTRATAVCSGSARSSACGPRQLHRDDPRHHPPRLWRDLQPPLLGISARLDRDHHRLGGDRDDRVQPVDPARPACSNSSSPAIPAAPPTSSAGVTLRPDRCPACCSSARSICSSTS